MPHVREGPATEFRPGTYVFGDVQQLVLGAVDAGDIALHVVATVLAQRDGQVVLDAGAKALGRDRPQWLDGHGRLADCPATIAKVYDHHAIVLQDGGKPSFAIGDRVRIVPNNVNSVMALRRYVWVDDGSGTLLRHETLQED
jgi:D-serine deaminase-like pyridoxal phosphate-dependent protein